MQSWTTSAGTMLQTLPITSLPHDNYLVHSELGPQQQSFIHYPVCVECLQQAKAKPKCASHSRFRRYSDWLWEFSSVDTTVVTKASECQAFSCRKADLDCGPWSCIWHHGWPDGLAHAPWCMVLFAGLCLRVSTLLHLAAWCSSAI